METWFVVTSTICIAFVLYGLLSLKSKPARSLPPGPRSIPIISTIVWLRKSGADIEATIKNFTSKFGPIITLPVGLRPAIIISRGSLAHEALIHKGSIFADRPKPEPTAQIFRSNQHNIATAAYGPKWRTLRRNLTTQILHPSRAKEFSHARKWTLDILLNRLRDNEVSDVRGIKAIDHFRFGMFCLLVSMCFGEKLDESKIREIEAIQFKLLSSLGRFGILNRWPRITRVLLRSQWNELYDIKKKHKEVLLPLIRKRQQHLHEDDVDKNDGSRLANCYVDTLLNLELPDNNNTTKKLNEEEILSGCSEFLNAGTDTTSTALEWIMANVIKYPDIQAKICQEIKEVCGEKAGEIEENSLSKMFYLKAVVLEGLRRHPPGHFVLQHAVTQEVELGGYIIPKDAMINFSVAEMGRDPEVWEDPMKFWPERFLSSQEEFDMTGRHEIKMMPFGAGRRMCPAYALGMLHLQYYVANLVWNFKWRTADGYEVDLLSEKQELFSMVMKHRLHALVSPRQNN